VSIAAPFSVAVCPFCESEAEWPNDILAVYTKRIVDVSPFNVKITTTGVLETGAYRDRMPDDEGRMVRLRKEHGVHFLEVGADLLARQLERRLVEDGWLEAVG